MTSALSWKKNLRYKLEFVGLRLAAGVLARIPFSWIAPMADFLGATVYHLDAGGRRTALENLRVALGTSRSPAERKRIAKKSYQTFARTMLSMFWLPNLNKENFSRYISIEGRDNHSVHGNPELAGVYFLAHYSNFEWLSWVSSHAIMAGLVITQEMKNPLLNETFNQLRTGSGHTLIPRGRALVRMLKFLKTGGKVGAAADLSIDPRLGAVPVRCFGMWTPLSPMAAVLSKRANAALVPSLIFPEPDGRYRVVYRQPLHVPPEATHQEITQACWDVFEEIIRERPEFWLWSYKHWRFRPSAPTDQLYPDYANTAGRFDRLLADAGVAEP
jgi:Kdo2-lipid IVA lauroyltransferase/acyltransferase